jgi:hypothetical protein
MNRLPGSSSDCSTSARPCENWTPAAKDIDVRSIELSPAFSHDYEWPDGHRSIYSRHTMDTGNCTIVTKSGHTDKSQYLTMRVAYHWWCASTSTVCTSPICLSPKAVSPIPSLARSSGHVVTRTDTKADIIYISLVSIGQRGCIRAQAGTVLVPARVSW